MTLRLVIEPATGPPVTICRSVFIKGQYGIEPIWTAFRMLCNDVLQKDGLKGFFWPRQHYKDEAAVLSMLDTIRSSIAKVKVRAK